MMCNKSLWWSKTGGVVVIWCFLTTGPLEHPGKFEPLKDCFYCTAVIFVCNIYSCNHHTLATGVFIFSVPSFVSMGQTKTEYSIKIGFVAGLL